MTAELPGRLGLRGLRCPGPLLADVSLDVDLAPAARSNDLADAVDIAMVADSVRALVAAHADALLERLTVDAAHRLLEQFAAVDQVRVRVARPEPAGLDAAEESVEVTLRRPL